MLLTLFEIAAAARGHMNLYKRLKEAQVDTMGEKKRLRRTMSFVVDLQQSSELIKSAYSVQSTTV